MDLSEVPHSQEQDDLKRETWEEMDDYCPLCGREFTHVKREEQREREFYFNAGRFHCVPCNEIRREGRNEIIDRIIRGLTLWTRRMKTK